jgi:multicomponent Na+:H+ antiporter subunit E
VGLAAIWFIASRASPGSARYLIRWRRTIGFVLFYLKELVMANVNMAVDVLRPQIKSRPAILRIPLDAKTNSDTEITLLANLISLTPGTLTLDVVPDRCAIYVHVMDVPGGDIEKLKEQMKWDYERRVLEVLH